MRRKPVRCAAIGPDHLTRQSGILNFSVRNEKLLACYCETCVDLLKCWHLAVFERIQRQKKSDRWDGWLINYFWQESNVFGNSWEEILVGKVQHWNQVKVRWPMNFLFNPSLQKIQCGNFRLSGLEMTSFNEINSRG